MHLFRNMQEPESTDITTYPGYTKLSSDQQKKVAETYSNVFNNSQGRVGIKIAQGIAFETAKKMCESFDAAPGTIADAVVKGPDGMPAPPKNVRVGADGMPAPRVAPQQARLLKKEGEAEEFQQANDGLVGMTEDELAEKKDPISGMPTYDLEKTAMMKKIIGSPVPKPTKKKKTVKEDEEGVVSGANPEEDGAAKLLRLNHDKMCMGCGAIHPLDVVCFNGGQHSEGNKEDFRTHGFGGAGDILKQNHAQKGMKVEDADPMISAAASYLTNRAKVSGLMESLEEGAEDIQKKNVGSKCPDCGAIHDSKEKCKNGQCEPDTDKETEKEIDDANAILKKNHNDKGMKEEVVILGHHIFCPSCKNVLDHKNTVIATHKGTGKTSVSCGDCYDKGINKLKVHHGHDVINKHVHDNFDVVDGRSPKKQAKEPKPEKPEGALKKPQHVKGQGSFRFKPGVKVESEELGEEEVDEGLKRNLLWAKDAVQVGARNLGRDIKADGLKKAVKSGVEDAKAHYKMKGESESEEGPSCPDCGSSKVSFHPARHSWKNWNYHCHGCGSKGDGDDAAPRMKKLKEAIELMWAENYYPAKPMEEHCGHCGHPKSYHNDMKECGTCNECEKFTTEAEVDEGEKKKQICFCGHAFGNHGKGGCHDCKHEGIMDASKAAHQFRKNDYKERFEDEYADIFIAQQGKIYTAKANASLNWLPEEEIIEGKTHGFDDIEHGDSVKYKTPQGQVHSGTAHLYGGSAGHHWVLRNSSKHGGMGSIVTPENFHSVRKSGKPKDPKKNFLVYGNLQGKKANEEEIQEENNYPDYHEVLNRHGYKSKGADDEGHRYEHSDGSHVTLHASGSQDLGHFHAWTHKGKNKKLVGNTGDSPKSLDSHLKGVARAHRSSANRKDRDDVMRSMGLNKVKGSVSGKTYWEAEEEPEKDAPGPTYEQADPMVSSALDYINYELARAGKKQPEKK